jgi:hypothetical protein
MKEYFYLIGKERNGPITVAEIIKKDLPIETYIWCDGMDDWKKLKDLPEFLSKTPPPLPKELMEVKLDSAIKNETSESVKIDLTGNKFIIYEELVKNLNYLNENLIGFQNDLIIDEFRMPSLYIRNNNYLEFSSATYTPGLKLMIYSYKDKVSFFIEKYNEPREKDYDISNSYFLPLLDINRSGIIKYRVEKNKKIKIINLKNTDRFLHIAGMGLAVMSRGILGQLFVQGVLAASRAIEDDVVEIEGAIFFLECTYDNKIIEIEIACHPTSAINFEQFVKKTWVKGNSATYEEVKHQNINSFKIGDKVIISRIFFDDIGEIIDIEKNSAKIIVVNNNVISLESENIEYTKLKKLNTDFKVGDNVRILRVFSDDYGIVTNLDAFYAEVSVEQNPEWIEYSKLVRQEK